MLFVDVVVVEHGFLRVEVLVFHLSYLVDVLLVHLVDDSQSLLACDVIIEWVQENLVLPESVVSMKGNLFSHWNGDVKCLSPNFILEDGVLFNKDKSTIISFRDKDITSYVIPDYVTSIGGDAFSGCESLTSLVIPDSVTHIAVGAFLSCTSLSSVVIPDGVTRIGEGAFIGCESLKSIVIPDGVVSMEKDAFRDCNFPNDFKQELISRFGEEIFGN